MSPEELLTRLGERLDTEAPTPQERETLLAMAGIAAHSSSERWVAPLACWMAGRAGVTPDEAAAVVREITA